MSYPLRLNATCPLQRALLLAFLVLSTAPLGAQTSSPGMQTASPVAHTESLGSQIIGDPGTTTVPSTAISPSANNITVTAVVEHDFEADLKNGGNGNMSVNAFELYGNYGTHLTDRDQLIVSADYLYLNYHFDGTPEPFGNVEQIGATGWYTHDFKSDFNMSPDFNWGVFGYLYGGFAAETAGSMSDGGQGAVALGPTVDVLKQLKLSFGPMYYSRIEEDGAFTIMADMRWDFLPQWSLEAYAGISDGATVTYDVFNDRKTLVDASLEYNRFWFATRDLPGGAEGGVEERNSMLKFGVRQALSENFFVRGFISAIFDRKYQFHVNDNSAGSFEVDPTVGIGVELGVSF